MSVQSKLHTQHPELSLSPFFTSHEFRTKDRTPTGNTKGFSSYFLAEPHSKLFILNIKLSYDYLLRNINSSDDIHVDSKLK